ncbi:MAG: hypothetical protein J3Q66DRAFT_359683, partial [Benniella sp.]
MFKSLALIAAILCTTHIPALVSGAVPSGKYVIRNSANCTQVLDENRETRHAIGWRFHGGNNQRWIVAPTNASRPLYVTIRNAETLNYVTRTGDMQVDPFSFMVNSTKNNGDTSIIGSNRELGIDYGLSLSGANDGALVEGRFWAPGDADQLWWFVAV